MTSSSVLVKYMILFILAMCAYMYIETDYINDVKFVKSNVDNHTYLVRNTHDAVDAANLLAQIRAKLTEVVAVLHEKHPGDPRTQRLKQRFNPHKLSENSPTSQYTSYSVNKGEKIVFCLRAKEQNNTNNTSNTNNTNHTNNNSKTNQALHDFNTMTFVGLHELAHLMTESVGHTAEFWDNFRFILKNCIKHKLYEYQDFRAKPVRYCGTDITDSPLH